MYYWMHKQMAIFVHYRDVHKDASQFVSTLNKQPLTVGDSVMFSNFFVFYAKHL